MVQSLANADGTYAHAVMGYAGKSILPMLHEALQSQDRVVRSNSARGCGRIGDASSIKPLLAALDLESGLSRASIVWALGELRAAEALPQLIQLYTAGCNDAGRHRGFLRAQNDALMGSEYQQLASLGAIARDYEKLQQLVTPGVYDPRKYEQLLEPDDIIKAVAKIGAVAAAPFYHTLAADKHVRARLEAAKQLGSGAGTAEDCRVLRHLLGDESRQVQTIAAVSLLMLNDQDIQARISHWLGSDSRHDLLASELCRISDPRQVAFLQAELPRLAQNSDRTVAAWAKTMLTQLAR